MADVNIRNVIRCPPQFQHICRIGDYPGQGEVSGMSHQGKRACHWCTGCWPQDAAFKRNCFGGHHRWLAPGNPLRPAGNTDTAPEARTPEGVAHDAQVSQNSDADWTSEGHPRRASGVNGVSALSFIPLFNIIWDVMPDWMHIIKNLILNHFIKVAKGKRRLTMPKYKRAAVDATPAQVAAVQR